MHEAWQYQLRVYLSDAHADLVRSGDSDPALLPLTEALARHGATLVSQLDAFERYVEEAEAAGPEGFSLYRWTKATLADPAKRAKHKLVFAVRVAGQEVYPPATADALEAELTALVGPVVARVSRHDTNPANSLPVPEQYRS